jgi:hypothetical protein
MKRGFITRAALLAVIMLLGLPGNSLPLPAAQGTQDQNNSPPKEAEKPESKKTKLHIVVTAGQPAAPVQAAHVDVSSQEDHPDLPAIKITDPSGVVDLDVPRGKVLIQVIAQHWSTDGVYCKLTKKNETVRFTLVSNSSPQVAPIVTCDVYEPNADAKPK